MKQEELGCSEFFWFGFVIEIRIPEVQERVADAVNNIVKHFYKPEKEVSMHNDIYFFFQLLNQCIFLLCALPKETQL